MHDVLRDLPASAEVSFLVTILFAFLASTAAALSWRTSVRALLGTISLGFGYWTFVQFRGFFTIHPFSPASLPTILGILAVVFAFGTAVVVQDILSAERLVLITKYLRRLGRTKE